MKQDRQSLSAKHAQVILKFLERVTLRGEEAPAFMEVVAVLNAAAQQAADTGKN